MKKTILLVDDTATVLMFEKMLLMNSGYIIREAKNGQQALDAVAESPPDLILLDIMMPDIDGIEVCRRLKSDPATTSIPIIMVTTKGEQEMIERAFAAGCNDFTTKPLDKAELEAKMARHLG